MKTIINAQLFEFLASFYKIQPGELGKIQEKAYTESIPIIPLDVVAFLKIILALKQPKNILEIGCAIGFSAGLMAHCAPNANITSIDRYPQMITKAKQNFKTLGITNRVNLIEKDAIIALPELVKEKKSFDIIFLDAGKGQYINFLPHILELLAPNAIFLADNILQNSSIALKESDIEKRQRTIYRNMRKFLNSTFENLECSILPIGDGILFARRSS